MIARKSVLERSSQRISRLSSTSRRDSLINEKEWEWKFLRNQCKIFALEQFYVAYMQRLRVNFLKLFIIIELLVAGGHCFILLWAKAQSLYVMIAIAFTFAIEYFRSITIAILAYIISALVVCGILALNFYGNLTQRYSWMTFVTSYGGISILVLMDMGVTIYHAVANLNLLKPFLDSCILYAVYMFIPLRKRIQAFILGLSVTVLYLLTYAFVTYGYLSQEGKLVYKVTSEAIFLLSINLLGIYFRMMRENAIRITFLDRRKYVEECLSLRYAREQEQRLLLNVIPIHIVDKIGDNFKSRLQYEMSSKRRATPWKICRRRHMQTKKPTSSQPEYERLYVEPHQNVTILYADVVNYTHLTTTLDVKTLVETLHDLFVQFDTASEKYNVLRIKFLGDCYYAVAGIAAPNKDHAKCCVELGLHMIAIIRDIRTQRNLNIGMRIGVHTGSILSGVIGSRKIQYDIWSKDVDIACRLEKTGIAGTVHVSKETLTQLGGEYMFDEGTEEARADPVLRNFGIHTYVIKPPKSSAYKPLPNPVAHADFGGAEYFMQYSDTAQFDQMQMEAELEMNSELEKMPIGRIEFPKCGFQRTQAMTPEEMEEKDITPLCQCCDNWHCEMQFLIASDDMLKYNVIMGVIIFVAITAMNFVTHAPSMPFRICSIFFIVLLASFLFLTWFKKLWIIYFAENVHSMPKNTFVLFFFNASKHLQSSMAGRIAIYLLIITIHFSATFIQLLDCKSDINFSQKNNSQGYTMRRDGELCFDPWSITKSLELTICMVFLFTRIPFFVKLCVSILIWATYSMAIFVSYSTIFEVGPSTTIALPSKYCHIVAIIITFASFYLLDRQNEFLSKVDYNLKRQLHKKQEDAEIANAYITMLIHNILPVHVADIYITKQMQNELYYEEHDDVAVMFASIKNYDIEKVGLTVLNDIICGFDEVLKLFETEGGFKVEKIKVAGWNYMAACGLDVLRIEDVTVRNSFQSKLIQQNAHDPQPSTIKQSTNKKKKLAITLPHGYQSYVMTRFALHLMKIMHGFNAACQQCEVQDISYGMLRIGISNGPVMAGVIGSYKPHYDIWGDCVNMASRMAHTGIPGHIHVTENTAQILNSFNIECNSRGMTDIKGRGQIPTYFVAVDENFNFVRK